MNTYTPREKQTIRPKTRKQPKKKTTHAPQTHYLPTLTTPNNGEAVIAVTVKELPLKGEGGAKTWVVDEAPSRRLGNGQLVSLKNSQGETGPGLLSAITDLRQHWITWSVSGGPEKVRVQIPIPWADMTGVGAMAHAKLFNTLPPHPAPHQDATPDTSIAEGQYPYAYDIGEKEQSELEERLDGITKRKWEWRPERERKRRRREVE